MTKNENSQLIEKDKSKTWSPIVTLEPTVCLFFVALYNSQTLEVNLLLEKRLTFDDENEAERVVAQIDSWKVAIYTFFSVLVGLYAGLISDHDAKFRVLFLYIPIIGQILNDSLNCLHVYLWYWPVEIAAVSQALVTGLTGSRTCFAAISISYLSHLSNKQLRTTKIGHFFVMMGLGIACGIGISGYALSLFSFYGGFTLSILANVFGIICALVFVKVQAEVDADLGDTRAVFPSVFSIFDCVKILLKLRKSNRKLVVLMSVLTYPLLVGAINGQLSVLYLYFRNQLQWDAIQFGVFTFLSSVIGLIGTTLCAEVLSKKLGLYDATIGLIGSLLWMAGSFLYIFARSTVQVYAVSFLSVALQYSIFTVDVSIGSKCVQSSEYGQLNALYGLMEGITPLVYPLYNQVYKATLDVFPSAFFIITILFNIPIFVLFTIMRIITNKSVIQKPDLDSDVFKST